MRKITMLLGIIMVLTLCHGTLSHAATTIASGSGDTTITTNGDYQLDDGYSGTITIGKDVTTVSIIGYDANTIHSNTNIIVDSGRTEAGIAITINNLNMSTKDDGSINGAIDFGNAVTVENKLYIKGSNTIKAIGNSKAGIHIPAGVGLTIDKAPSVSHDTDTALNVTGGKGAGIGGKWYAPTGMLTIEGGTINVTSGEYSAGIGSGAGGTSGTITINGGIINATGRSLGAAIGGGDASDGGIININGGDINAVDDWAGAGIGGGSTSDGGTITINGGNITAKSVMGAGIGGGGSGSDSGTITINGGNINAKSETGGAGIGGGANGSGGTITINEGNITVEGFEGAGIGGGFRSDGGTININGGNINATSIYSGAGIGGGSDGSGGTITIAGNANIIAVSKNANDIGNGIRSSASFILQDENNNPLKYIRAELKEMTSESNVSNTDVIVTDNNSTRHYKTNVDGWTGIFVANGVGNFQVQAVKHKKIDDDESSLAQNNVRYYKLESLPQVTIQGTPILHHVANYNESSGRIEVTASGGNGNSYQYSIDGGENWDDATILEGLSAGIYEVQIRDGEDIGNYSEIITVTITQPEKVTITLTSTHVTAYSGSNGRIEVTSSGGKGTYEYSKDDGSNWQDDNIFDNLSSGTYTVKSRDKVDTANVSNTVEVIITQPKKVSINVISTPASYATGNDGRIEVSASGGKGTYEYSKDGGSNWQDESIFENLSAGIYTVQARDKAEAYNTSDAVEVNIIQLALEAQPSIQIDYVNEKLTGFDNGEDYTINGITVKNADGAISIDSSWLGTDLDIVKKGNGTTTSDSTPQTLAVPARPNVPNENIQITKTENSITITNTTDYTDCEYSKDGINWQEDAIFTNLKSDTEYTLCIRKKATTDTFSSELIEKTVKTSKAALGTGSVLGKVIDENDFSIIGATVKITKKGIQGEAIDTQITNSQGEFSFNHITYGVYSLVATNGSKTATKTIVIDQTSVTQDIVLQSRNKSTIVEVKSNTPPVAADNLDNMFSAEDIALADIGTVEIKLSVEKKEESSIISSEKTKIQAKVTSGKKVGIYLDAKLLKTIIGTTSSDVTDEQIQPPAGQKVKITLDLPLELQNKAPYEIIRMHNGVAETLPAIYNSTLQTLTFEADKFSTYAIAYTDSTDSSTSSGGSSYDYYMINAEAESGGTISPEGNVSVRERGNKTFAIIPDEGYDIFDVLVDGKSVGPVKDYTFESIDKVHTITAQFRKAEQNPFDDIQEKDWYYESVLEINMRNIMQGTSENKFGPNLKTTRGMIATIIYQLEGSNEKIESHFMDVEKNQYYYDAIGWAEKNGIVKGYGNDAYGPNDTITREQLVVILYRYSVESKDSSISPDYTGLTKFSDKNEISEYAKPAMAWAYERGVINGKGNNILDPKGFATRAEAAKTILNYMNLKEK